MNTSFDSQTRKELRADGIKTPKLNVLLSKFYPKIIHDFENFGYGSSQVQPHQLKHDLLKVANAINDKNIKTRV